MNLPLSFDDPSLLGHEPLRSRIATFECAEGQRSVARQSLAEFVKEMQQDSQAAAAAKEWGCLTFQDVLPDGYSLKLKNGGKELYEVFFHFQYLLYKGLKEGNADAAYRYRASVFKEGLRAINAKPDRQGANARRTKRGGGSDKDTGKDQAGLRSCPKKARQQLETHVHHPDAGDIETSGSIGHGSPSSKDIPAIKQESSFGPPDVVGVRPSTLPKAERSTSEKEKRKASSQKPPVITPSDGSEDSDEYEPSDVGSVTAANSVSHRSKRIASNPRQPHDLLKSENRADKINSAYKAETTEQDRKGAINISQARSSLINSQSDDPVSHPSVKGRRNKEFQPNGRKRGRSLSISAQLAKTRLNFRRLQKKLGRDRDSQPPAKKQLRRASMPSLRSKPEEGDESTCILHAEFPQEQTIRVSADTGPRLVRGNVKPKARQKRTRLEFETTSVPSVGTESVDSGESLGPDNRLTRPLPRKVRNVRFAPVVRGVPSGAPSLEHVDQILCDAASNALAVMQEGVGPHVSDWTEDDEHDAECDDLVGEDQSEEIDVQLATTTSDSSKPPVPAPPRMWAHSRQEVCESFEYFRSYHSGVYSKGDIVRGYLLGGYAASRDKFHCGGKLIISHGGGKSESILEARRGPRRFQADQDQEASDKSVRALLKTWKDRRPIVLLADDKYALFPYDLCSANYSYVVLGLYWISHAWAECQPSRDGSGRIVRWKFAFQWCEDQGDPWWLSQQDTTETASDLPKSISNPKMCPTVGSSYPANPGQDQKFQCEHCQEYSPFVYKQGRMCLNPRCDLFWSIDGEDPKQLDYREEFLQLLPQEFERLPIITPTRMAETPGGITTTYACSKGWHCTKCGRLSCRYKWECWECSNCKSKHEVKGRVRSPKEFWHQRPSKGYFHSQVGKSSGILACRLEPIDLGVNKGFTNRLTFILPHGRGKIHLILGTPLSNGEADNIFQLYQQQAATSELKLRRYPLRNHRARGPLLTNYFSQNSGEPYQYVGGSGQTVPFSEAPECIQRALALIKERAGLALHTDIPFNEVLSAAYMERQKMSFHSDSEKGLGPTVASLSLGSAALMHFRRLVNVDNQVTKSSIALTLVLRHGDVLIMDGDGVQKYYEHTVIPMNFRIAATARWIGNA